MKLIPRMRSPRHSAPDLPNAKCGRRSDHFVPRSPPSLSTYSMVAEGDVRFGVRLHVAGEPFEAVGAHHVVGAEQFCVPAAGSLQKFKNQNSRARPEVGGHVDVPYARVAEGARDLAASVVRGVVEQYELKVPARLGEYGFYALR